GGSTYCRALTTDAHLLAICLCDPAPSARGYDAARRVRLRVEVAVGAVVRAGPAGGADRDRVAARLVALAGDEVALLGPGRRVVVLGVQHAVADDAQVERHAVTADERSGGVDQEVHRGRPAGRGAGRGLAELPGAAHLPVGDVLDADPV